MDGLKCFWLSFADPNLPKGSQFLGACIVEAGDERSAHVEATVRKINPGGEIMFVEVPADKVPADRWLNRLLSRDDIAELERDAR